MYLVSREHVRIIRLRDPVDQWIGLLQVTGQMVNRARSASPVVGHLPLRLDDNRPVIRQIMLQTDQPQLTVGHPYLVITEH